MTNTNNKGRPSISRSKPLVIRANVVTYRLGEKLVYVIPAENYDKALQCAYKVFPKELNGISSERITFVVCAIVAGEHRTVYISPQAWPEVIPTLARFEIIDISVTPEIRISADTSSPNPPSGLPTVVEVSETSSFTDETASEKMLASPSLDVNTLPGYEDVTQRRSRSESPDTVGGNRPSALSRWMKRHS